MTARIGEGEELEWSASAAWPQGGILGGFAQLLGEIPVNLFALMPRESLTAQAYSYDLRAAFDLFQDVLERHSPEDHESMVAALDGLKSEQGIDLENDVFAPLAGGFGSFRTSVPPGEGLNAFSAMAGGGGEELPAVGDAYLVELADRERFSALVDKLLALGEGAVVHTTESFQGVPVHSLDLQGMVQLHWAFLEDAFIVGLGPTPVRAALRLAGDEDAPSILADEKYASVIRANRAASGLTLTDTAQALRFTLRTFEGVFGMLPMIAAMSGDPEAAQSPLGPDTPWPKVSTVDRYFDGVSSTTLALAGGRLSLRVLTQ